VGSVSRGKNADNVFCVSRGCRLAERSVKVIGSYS
jgi:hypothetical protein